MADKCNMHIHWSTSEIPLHWYFNWKNMTSIWKKSAPTIVEDTKNFLVLKEIHALLDILRHLLKPKEFQYLPLLS